VLSAQSTPGLRTPQLRRAYYGASTSSLLVHDRADRVLESGVVALVEHPALELRDPGAWIAKGGSYQYGGSLPYQVSWDGLSMTGVPYKNVDHVVTPSYFVFGEFVDGTTINSTAQANSINTARGEEYQQAMRPYIHAALATW
jgi:hypothetical protein